ncbi:hypothetical protein M758_5G027000 [Ceratodon purpureus]|uniref:Dof-type domain-containing protein n=1 Tax=Ceratodon purpureus TaxID=3225 RepID=A0A8T0HYE9_CERPU|nr:hypothetical protein KC19_5G025500 [Ceratodon purpureus]KAG0615256.1 hypothetical protein M758_5G027000 [Ceratodon purpureus]
MLMMENHVGMGGEGFLDETEGRVGDDAGTGGSGESEEQLAMSRGNGGAIRDKPVKVIPCPRCQSMNTKFCYYNNYSVTQPRHFCRNCQRYWTVGGTLRNVPVGGGSRKKTRTRSRSDPYHIPTYDSNATPQSSPGSESLLNASNCMQQLSMLPPSLGFMPGMGASGFPTGASQLPFLQSALEGLYPRKPLAGLQEVPDLQSVYDAPQVPQIAPMMAPPMMMNGMSFFTPQSLPSQNESLVSVMAKAGLWSSAPMQAPVEVPGSWEEQQKKALQQLGGYGQRNLNQNAFGENLKPGFWETAMLNSRPVMNDRLVPHASWDESNPSTTNNTPNLSPNGSSTTDNMPNPSFSHGYYEDVSQPWVGLHASDILNF